MNFAGALLLISLGSGYKPAISLLVIPDCGDRSCIFGPGADLGPGLFETLHGLCQPSYSQGKLAMVVIMSCALLGTDGNQSESLVRGPTELERVTTIQCELTFAQLSPDG